MARAEVGRAKGHRQESKLALYSAYGGLGQGVEPSWKLPRF